MHLLKSGTLQPYEKNKYNNGNNKILYSGQVSNSWYQLLKNNCMQQKREMPWTYQTGNKKILEDNDRNLDVGFT